MTVQVKCPNRDCDQQLMLSPEMAGKKGQCPKCGKTFQIPSNLGNKTGAAGQKTKSASSASVAKSQSQTQQRPSSRPTKSTSEPQKGPVGSRPQSTARSMPAEDLSQYVVEDDSDEVPVAEAVEVDEVYEAEVVGGYDDRGYEEPRRRRRPRPRDDFDEPDDDFDDVPMRHGSKPTISKTRRWKLGNVGFLILAIASCVVGGSLVMEFLAEMFLEISMASSSLSLANAGTNFIKIAEIFGFLGTLAWVVGYVFCIFIPNKNASLGLAIAALSLGAVNMVMRIIFKMVPALTTRTADVTHVRGLFAIFGGLADVGYEILCMFLELGFFAEIMLVSLFMAAVAKTQRDGQHKRDCMRTVWFLTGVAGIVFVEFIFMMIGIHEKWALYLVRIMNWAANGLLAVAFVFHILNQFYSYRSTK